MKRIILATMLALPALSHAAGFALIENNASGMGNAYAGASAIAQDASTIWFNPAGMTYIEGTQVVGAIHLIKPTTDFNDDGSVAAAFQTGGGDGGDIGDLAFVPNFYYKRDLTDTLKFGLGVNAPFGLKTEYDKDWIGRFQAVKSDLKTVNINPALAFKVNDKLSLGFGISAMWIQAELTRAVSFGPFGEGSTKVKGDDWGFGYNFGAIYQATEDTRIGLAFRSKIDQNLDGDVKFSLPTPAVAALAPDGDVTAGTTLPETLSLSVFSHLNNKWDVMGDVTWTKWSRFRRLAIFRDNGSLLSETPENWDNSLRYSIGTTYHYSDKLQLRAGLAYDEEPIDTEFRTPRIPGNDRKWLSLGAGWQYSPNTKLDIGYAHLFVSDPKISDDQIADGNGLVQGSYDGHADILSLQVTHNF